MKPTKTIRTCPCQRSLHHFHWNLQVTFSLPWPAQSSAHIHQQLHIRFAGASASHYICRGKHLDLPHCKTLRADQSPKDTPNSTRPHGLPHYNIKFAVLLGILQLQIQLAALSAHVYPRWQSILMVEFYCCALQYGQPGPTPLLTVLESRTELLKDSGYICVYSGLCSNAPDSDFMLQLRRRMEPWQ